MKYWSKIDKSLVFLVISINDSKFFNIPVIKVKSMIIHWRINIINNNLIILSFVY